MNKNKKSVIVITGGTRGLGAILVHHFAATGHQVVMNYRNQAVVDQCLTDLSQSAPLGKVLAIRADVRYRQEVAAMFDQVDQTLGGADVLINCAGVNRDGAFLALTDDDWDTVVDTHLKGTFICSQEFAQRRTRQGGTANIITLGAACGIQGRLNGANFCSSKGGILALTKCMARELAPQIRVNCLTPSAVDTQEVRERYALDTPAGLRKVLNGIPMQRLGVGTDVIHMVETILDADFTTGANFFVNGGEFML